MIKPQVCKNELFELNMLTFKFEETNDNLVYKNLASPIMLHCSLLILASHLFMTYHSHTSLMYHPGHVPMTLLLNIVNNHCPFMISFNTLSDFRRVNHNGFIHHNIIRSTCIITITIALNDEI